MSLVAAIRTMLEKGLSVEQALIAAEAIESSSEHTDTRSTAAKRQARYRERNRNESVTKRNEASHVTVSDAKVSPSLSPKEKSPPNTPSKEITPNSPPSKRAAPEFSIFWQAWPHKVGRPAAERAFKPVAGELEAILEGLQRYIRDKPPDRPWLNPATFLNQRRWEDQPAENVAQFIAKPKERDLRNIPDNLLSAEDYWKKRKQQKEWA